MPRRIEDQFLNILTEFLKTRPDPRYQQTVNELAVARYQWHFLKAVRMTKKQATAIGPAASLGLFFNGPVGYIFLSDELEANLTLDEFRFVVAHEMSHIARSHSVATMLALYFEQALSEIFSKQLVTLLKALFYAQGRPVLDHALARSNELEADQDAIGLTGDIIAGISTLEKLARIYANGNLDSPSHFAHLGNTLLPAVTFRERIDNLRLPTLGLSI